jgi:FAD/FMN-containing dehydrogenase
LDNLISAQVVLANSTTVTASATENTDLFWSLRGAGAAFGIVTSFTFKTFDAPEDNLVYSYTMQSANAPEMASQLAILQNFTLYDQPPELNMRLFLNSGQLTGVYYGSRSAYNAIMLPLLSKLRIAASDSAVSTKSWTDTLLAFSNGPLKQPEPYDYHETQYAKSLMPDRLSTAALSALSNYFFNTARSIGRPYYLLIDMHGGNSSAISQVGADATSYAHRNAVFKMQFYDIAFGNYNSNWYSFLTNWVKAITDASPGEKFGMYINYADTQLNSTDAHTRYWGSHYERLAGIKTKYDPGKVFYGPQLVGS